MADQSQQEGTPEFFIADLCVTKPVMFMLILAELPVTLVSSLMAKLVFSEPAYLLKPMREVKLAGDNSPRLPYHGGHS